MSGPAVSVLAGRRAVVTGAARTAERIGGEVLVLDLSRTGDLHDLRPDADILVNNAGVQHVAPIEQSSRVVLDGGWSAA